MSYTIHEEKRYSQSVAEVFTAANGAVGGLQGKMVQEDAANSQLEAQFDKSIHGKLLGDRTRFIVRVVGDGTGAVVKVEAFPIDPVGRPLQFGARKGVTRTVLDWYWAHIEHRLK